MCELDEKYFVAAEVFAEVLIAFEAGVVLGEPGFDGVVEDRARREDREGEGEDEGQPGGYSTNFHRRGEPLEGMDVIKFRSYIVDLLEYPNRKKDSLSLFNNTLAEISQRCALFELCALC